jgi:hypothetical protein
VAQTLIVHHVGVKGQNLRQARFAALLRLDFRLDFVDSHRKLVIVAREVNFGVEVASMFWTERLAIETAAPGRQNCSTR